MVTGDRGVRGVFVLDYVNATYMGMRYKNDVGFKNNIGLWSFVIVRRNRHLSSKIS